MLLKFLPVLIISLILFYVINKDKVKGVSLLVFLIPFDIIDPIGSLWGVPAKFFTSTIFIFVAYIAIFKGRLVFYNNKVLKDNFKFVFLLVWGLIFGLLFIDKITTVDQYSISTLGVTPLNQLIINFINVFILLLFLQILNKGTTNQKNLIQHIEWFCYSIFFQILNPLSFFISGKTIYQRLNGGIEDLSTIRIGGLFFNFEFTTDYALIIIIFSLILIWHNKKLPFLNIMLAIALGIVSGSRSFLILLILLIFLVTLFISKRYVKLRLPILIITISFFIGIYYLSQKFSSEVIVFNHLQESLDSYEENNVNKTFNRPYEDTWNIISQTPFSGFGNYNHVTSFNSYLTSHFFLLHAYVKFGIIGILLFLWIYIRDFKLLYQLKVNKGIGYFKYLLLILLIILFLQNLKISFLRYSTTIYVYGYIYFIIRYFIQTTSSQTNSEIEQ